MAPAICGSYVRNLPHVTLLMPRIFRWLLDFYKSVHPDLMLAHPHKTAFTHWLNRTIIAFKKLIPNLIKLHIHKHTHTHTHAHTCTHAHNAHAHAPTCPHTGAHIHTHTLTHNMQDDTTGEYLLCEVAGLSTSTTRPSLLVSSWGGAPLPCDTCTTNKGHLHDRTNQTQS